MSAKNWDQCPKCIKRKQAAIVTAEVALKNSYGKVPAFEYEQEMRVIEGLREDLRDIEPYLREDYSFSVSDASFSVYFACHCEECGFSFEFKHEAAIPGKGGAK